VVADGDWLVEVVVPKTLPNEGSVGWARTAEAEASRELFDAVVAVVEVVV